jgi:threonine 3-dehydrogenase
MKALLKETAAPGLRLTEVPEPKPGPKEILVRVNKAAICGTDLHIYQWDEWAQRVIKPPLILGHEFVGEVVALGVGSTLHQVGDRVSGEGHVTCGLCRNCRAGTPHLCHLTRGIGVHRDGAFAELIVMPESNLWPIHKNIPTDIAAFLDPLGNAVHCALSFDLVAEDVLITGAGPIGVMAAAICRHLGARHVLVTDINDYRLDLARQMGASLAINVTRDSVEDAIAQLGMSNGFDRGIEVSGNPDAFRNMLTNMYHGGQIALLGFLPSSTTIDWNQVILKSLFIKGIYGREMYETWYKMTQMIRSGLDVSPVVTHQLSLRDFKEGFAAMEAGRCGKIVLDIKE